MASAPRRAPELRSGEWRSDRLAKEPTPPENLEVQQLRGVFAAFDAGETGLLSSAELSAALLALGVEPTPSVLERFRSSSASPAGVDVESFLRVCASLTGAKSTAGDILELLRVFRDESAESAGGSSMSLGALRHVLSEVVTPSALSPQEVTDLFRMTGLVPMHLSPAKARHAVMAMPVDAEDARKRAASSGAASASMTTVDPEELLQLLCFKPPAAR